MSRQTAHHPRKWQKFNISSPKMPKNLANLSVLDSPLGDTPTEALEQDNATLKKQNKSLRYIVRLMERKILELTGHPAAALSVGLAKQTGQYKMNRTVFELLKDSEKGVKRMKRMESEGRLGGEGEGGGAGGGGGASGGGGGKHGNRHGGGRDGSDSEDASVRGDREGGPVVRQSNRERVRRRPKKDTKGDREGGGGEDGHGRGSGRGLGRGNDDGDGSDDGAQPDAAAAGAAAGERDNLPTNEAGRALWAGRRQEGRHRVGVSGGRAAGGGAVSDGDEGDYDGDDDFPGASYGGPKKHRRRRTRLASPEDDEEGGGVSARQSTPPSRATLNFAHTHDGTVAVRRNRRRAGGRHRDHLQFGRRRERGGEEDGADEDEDEDEEGAGEEGGAYVSEDARDEEMLEDRTREEERQQQQRHQHEDGGEDSAVANTLRDVDLRTLVKEEITMALRSHMSEILALAKGEAAQGESESEIENGGATPGRKGGQLRPLPAANHNEARQPNRKKKTNQKEKKTGRHNQLDPLEQKKGAKKNAKAATPKEATPTQKRRKKKKATTASPLRFGGPLPRGDGDSPGDSPLAPASVANNSERELAAIRIQCEVRERRERRRNQAQGIPSVTDEEAVEEVGSDDTGAEAEDANVGAETEVAQDAHATAIQSCYRGNQARKAANKRHTSATALQSRYRGKQARKSVDTQHSSATALQSRYRGKQARKSVDNQHTSATVLQARHRGKLSRRASKSAAEAAASAKEVAEAEEAAEVEEAAAVAEAATSAKVAAEAEAAAEAAASAKVAAEAEAAAAAETAEVEEAAAAAEAGQGNSGFGSEMHKTLTILFTTLDIDKDGFVDKGEVLGALRDPDESTIALLRSVPALAGLLKPQHFTKTFEAMDTNQDGAVDLGELLSFCEEGRHLYKAGDDEGGGGDGDDGEDVGNEVENGAENDVDEEQKQNEEARRTSAALSIQTRARGRSARKVAGAKKTTRQEQLDAASVLDVPEGAIGGRSTATVRPTSAELAEEFREQEQRVVAAVAIQKQVRGQSARNAMAKRREEGDPEENFSAEYARLQEHAEAVEAAGEAGEPRGEGAVVTGGAEETGEVVKEEGAEAVAGAPEGGEPSSFKALAEEGHAMVSEENKEANNGDEAGATVDVAGADEDTSHAAEGVEPVEAAEASAEETGNVESGNGESEEGAGGATGDAAGEAAVVRPGMT